MLTRAVLFIVVGLYTAFAAAPFLWVATMSVRTTSEISLDHYAWPAKWHWEKFAQAWFNSNYNVYFENSLLVVVSAVAVLTVVGSMAAHCFARYRFPANRVLYFVIFSTIIFPPQITIIALFQILVQYGLYDSLLGLALVYVAVQLPLTVYVLESFFARIPGDLFDAARIDGYSEWQIFWKVSLPIALPAIATAVILNTILLWNEFLYAVVLITDEITGPNGLCFSPDYKILYVADTGTGREIRAYDVDGGRVRNGRRHAQLTLPGSPAGTAAADGMRCDTDGNLWAGARPGVQIIAPDGVAIGIIRLPENCANVCFGGAKRNRLFMTASQSLYAVYVEAQGAGIA